MTDLTTLAQKMAINTTPVTSRDISNLFQTKQEAFYFLAQSGTFQCRQLINIL